MNKEDRILVHAAMENLARSSMKAAEALNQTAEKAKELAKEIEKNDLFERWLESLDIPLTDWQKEVLRVACTQPDKQLYISMSRQNGRHLVMKLIEQYEQMIKGEKKMQKKLEIFDMKDIHSGYVVRFRNGKFALCMRVGERFIKIFVCLDTLSMVTGAIEEKTFVYTRNYKGHAYYRYNPITRQHENYPDLDIVAVYGLVDEVKHYIHVGVCNGAYRPLLWEETAVKMTLEEIEKKLGYKVEIVGQETNIKSAELCDKCEYRATRMGCGKFHACVRCKMNVGKSVPDKALNFGTTICRCNTIASGEHCPYFKEAKK